MTQKINCQTQVINAARLALSCISNIACYRSGWEGVQEKRSLIINRDFWIRVNGNFLNIATLEWCKLFVDKVDCQKYGDHHWRNIFKNTASFFQLLLTNSKNSESDYIYKAKKIISYRNKYLAHLDIKDEQLFYPETEFMLLTVKTLYDELRTNPLTKHYIVGNYETASDFFENEFIDALGEIRKVN